MAEARSLFQIAGAIGNDAEVRVRGHFPRIDAEGFLKSFPRGGSIPALVRRDSIINELLCLLTSRLRVANTEGHNEAHKAQKGGSKLFKPYNHLCLCAFFGLILSLEDESTTYLYSSWLEDIGVAR